jgi:hypothetical protein
MASSDSSAPGTDGARGDGRQRSALIQALTSAGWLALAGWLAFVARAVDEARQMSAGSPLGGVWERRIEALSFVVFPQHVIVLTPAVVAAAVAGVLAGPLLDLRAAILLRITKWASIAAIAIAVVSIVSIAVSDSQGLDERGTVAFRIGGALIAAAFVIVLRAVERATPAG